MSAIDWTGFALGLAAGAGTGALFFAGLALGLRLALRARSPGAVLMLSGALRIAVLLGIGWLVAQIGASALAGFALAFLVVRFAAIVLARRPVRKEAERCS